MILYETHAEFPRHAGVKCLSSIERCLFRLAGIPNMDRHRVVVDFAGNPRQPVRQLRFKRGATKRRNVHRPVNVNPMRVRRCRFVFDRIKIDGWPMVSSPSPSRPQPRPKVILEQQAEGGADVLGFTSSRSELEGDVRVERPANLASKAD